MFLGSRARPVPPYVSRLSRQCRIFNISQRYKPPRPITVIALFYFTFIQIRQGRPLSRSFQFISVILCASLHLNLHKKLRMYCNCFTCSKFEFLRNLILSDYWPGPLVDGRCNPVTASPSPAYNLTSSCPGCHRGSSEYPGRLNKQFS
jgi:hypothetical protein